VIDLAGDLPQPFTMIERQPAVDGRQHPVPIEQHVKGDHRRDDQKGPNADQRSAARHKGARRAQYELSALGDQIAGRFLDLLGGNRIAQAETVSPHAAVFVDEKIALFDR